MTQTKPEWRKILLERRKSVSSFRRKEAAEKSTELTKEKGIILSFQPIGTEIDLSLLHRELLLEKRLFLLPSYKAPISFPLESIEVILVPALGFDQERYRLGYGKGFYDLFLSKAPHVRKIGVGFQELLVLEPLPHDPWDIPMDDLFLC